MSSNIGNQYINKIYIGSNQVSKIYKGSTLIDDLTYQPSPSPSPSPTTPPANDTLLLLRANSNWGPTDEGPNNYYFYNADGYEAGIMGNELASNNVYYSYSDPLWVSRAVGGGVSGPFSTSPLFSDSYEYSYTSLRGSDAIDLLSQMNGDFTIELWLAWYMDSTAPGYWGPSNLQMGETERYFRIGNIELGTALTRYWDAENNQTVAGYKTYIGPFGTYLPYNSTPESTDDIATVAYAATSNTGNIYQGTFPNNNSNYVHIAIVRDTTGSTYSDELRFYMDGTLIGTADLTSNGFNWNATTMSSNAEVAIYPYVSYNGHRPGIYYDDIRISNSVKYSGSTITVPSSALSGARSSASANTELLLHCDGGPADYGINKYYLSLRSQPNFSMINTPTSVTLDTTNKKFGSGSYSFSSSSNQYGIIGSEYSDYYAPIVNDLLVKLEAAEEYTIEMWIRPTGTMGANGEVYLAMGPGYDYVNKSHLVLMDSTNGPFDGNGGYYYNNYYSSGLRLVWVDSLVSYDETFGYYRNQYSISTSSLARNVWSHVAIVYNNGEWRLKVNGVDSGSSISSTLLTNTTTPLSYNTLGSTNHIILGAVLDSVFSPPQVPPSWIGTFNGNIDEIRFSSVDRYGSGSYTVPTAAFN